MKGSFRQLSDIVWDKFGERLASSVEVAHGNRGRHWVMVKPDEEDRIWRMSRLLTHDYCGNPHETGAMRVTASSQSSKYLPHVYLDWNNIAMFFASENQYNQ
jgi:hypothetical protein